MITGDMGGTSFDIGLVIDGQPIVVERNELQKSLNLALGSAMALFMYPHSVTAVLSGRSRNVSLRPDNLGTAGRLMRKTAAGAALLPAGDFRDWAEHEGLRLVKSAGDWGTPLTPWLRRLKTT